MKTAGIYINADNTGNDQDAHIADLLDKCYKIEEENKFVIIDSYFDIDGKDHERERLKLDIENNVIETVITNDQTIDELLINFTLII